MQFFRKHPPQTPPKRVDPFRLFQSRIQDLCLFFLRSFIPILHSKRFSRFQGPPSSFPQCHQIRSGFKIRALTQDILLNINFMKIQSPVCKLKILIFSDFSEVTVPPLLPRRSNRKRLFLIYSANVPDTPAQFHRPSLSGSAQTSKTGTDRPTEITIAMSLGKY